MPWISFFGKENGGGDSVEFMLSSALNSRPLEIISDIIGWFYFLAWSVSFYPQVILNYRRKCVEGLSFEFLAYNLTGFLFYLVFSLSTLIIQKREGLPASVAPNDVAFAAHAFVLTLVAAVQCLIYERKGQRFSRLHAIVCGAIWLLFFYTLFLSGTGNLPWYSSQSSGFQYSFLEFLGLSKLFISFIKYLPQALMNYNRKSTEGWPIQNVLLDLTGGLGSFLQQFLDAYNTANWSLFTANIPKLLLAVESIVFDVLFIVQHFILYRSRHVKRILQFHLDDDDHESLLNENDTSNTLSPLA